MLKVLSPAPGSSPSSVARSLCRSVTRLSTRSSGSSCVCRTLLVTEAGVRAAEDVCPCAVAQPEEQASPFQDAERLALGYSAKPPPFNPGRTCHTRQQSWANMIRVCQGNQMVHLRRRDKDQAIANELKHRVALVMLFVTAAATTQGSR